jgi:hypothetical protein
VGTSAKNLLAAGKILANFEPRHLARFISPAPVRYSGGYTD